MDEARKNSTYGKGACELSKGKKILIGVLIALAVVIIAALIFGGVLLSRIQYRSLDELAAEASQSPTEIVTATPTPSASAEPEEEQEEIVIADEVEQSELTQEEQDAMNHEQGNEVINVLLVGVDRRGGDGDSRSDSIMIATLDQPNQRLKLTSLMRDMYVSIPGYSDNRINRSAAEGGIPLLVDTINENFQMDLEYYVMVDFKMFEQVIDQLGGITIDMSRGEVAEANDCIAGLNKQRGDSLRSGFIKQREGGEVKLTGKQALGYARMRHFGGGDYARTSRQAKVMQEVLNGFVAAGPVKQGQIVYDLMPLIETNLSATQILGLMPKVLSVENKSIMHYRLPVEGMYKQKTIRGMWVLVPDIPANAKQLHWFLYDATEIEALPQSDTKKGSYHTKVPEKTSPPEGYVLDEEGELLLDENGSPIPITETPDSETTPATMETDDPNMGDFSSTEETITEEVDPEGLVEVTESPSPQAKTEPRSEDAGPANDDALPGEVSPAA